MAETKTAPARKTENTPARQGHMTEMVGENGTTSIADTVVAKIAGIAAREISGVHELVTQGLASSVSGLAQRITGADSRDRGVAVEVGQREAAVDLAIVVEYGASISQVTDALRENIISRVGTMTGLTVKEVNVFVTDLYFPEDQQQQEPPARRVE